MAKHIFRKDIVSKNTVDNFNQLSANVIINSLKDISSEIQGKIGDSSVRYLRKAINHLNLRNEFRSYAKSFEGMDEKNVCTFFLQEHLSELLSNVIRCGRIFENEEEDKTNRKHRKHRRGMRVYADKIMEIDCLFDEDCKKSFNNLVFGCITKTY